MNINPEALLDKKKIIKKVRFHDDEPIVVQATPDQPKVGTKRLLKNDELEEEEDHCSSQVDETAILEQEEKEILKQEELKSLKRQKVAPQKAAVSKPAAK